MNRKNKSGFLKQLLIWLWLLLKFILKIIPFLLKGIFTLLGKVLSPALGKFKKLFRFSITFKITVVYSFIIALLLFLSTTMILLGFRFFLFEQVRQSVDTTSRIVEDYLHQNQEIPQAPLEELARRNNTSISIFDPQRKSLYNSTSKANTKGFLEGPVSPSLLKLEAGQIILSNRQILWKGENVYLQVYKDLDRENGYIAILFVILLFTNGIGILITTLIGSKVSRRMLSPIARMTETVKAITIQDLDMRLDVGGSQDELKDLAETFNAMIDRIQASYEQQNRFVSDASHELRTPISVIQGYASLMDRWGKNDREVLEESISAIKGESENMKDLTEKLLFLARNDKNLLKLEKEDFLLSELIEEIAKETRLIDSKHQIYTTVADDMRLNADRKLLKQALRILVDNSVKYTPENGSIKISSYLRKKQLILEVTDTGQGIPKEDLTHVFDRFYRADKSRTKESGGHGLGLSIAKLIVDKHEGKIEIDSTLQAGTTVRITLPVK
ncbi:heavy metal sensor kinase [Geosporobacter subterraneus DSM 17957]|uniref:histidine kinase n=1 Tax=Geosporobacter subterraneus DSM 17957 TaxID=1121919 RepID=A0A1M6F660_9FIRM|nr:ATP-binding protein [Geosporobacter subterraneus]SHI93208.1 heavy metal sensor kinase [Geosporobacter subterraneus DSM 17957]